MFLHAANNAASLFCLDCTFFLLGHCTVYGKLSKCALKDSIDGGFMINE